MTSILVLLPVDGSQIQFIIGCEDPKDQYICLIRFLTDAKISLCSQEEYLNPNSLQAQQIYCVVKDGNLENAYTLFQCLPTPDWDSKEEKAPNFTSVIGSLAWVMVAKEQKCDPKQESVLLSVPLPTDETLPPDETPTTTETPIDITAP
jgi:hypothetical protein